VIALLFPSLWEVKQRLWPSAFRKQVMKAQDVLDEVSLSLIRKRKQERDAEELANDKCASTERIPNDFLDLLFDARDKTTGQALTEEEVTHTHTHDTHTHAHTGSC
jgi:cytochrome P450